MIIPNNFSVPGEHALWLEGLVGPLEGRWMVPAGVKPGYIAIIGHPHSLHGGTMHNKVVTTLARTFNDCGIPSIRFNFRGVGQSVGHYDAGFGESADMCLLARQLLAESAQLKLIFAGFSFGAFVSFRAAQQCPHVLLVSVAPPVNHFEFVLSCLPKCASEEQNIAESWRVTGLSDWLILQGEADEVVPYTAVQQFVQQAMVPVDLLCFANTGHFFHGKLLLLKNQLMAALQQRFVQV